MKDLVLTIATLLAFSKLQSAHHCVQRHRRNHSSARRFVLRVLLLLQREGREQAQVSTAMRKDRFLLQCGITVVCTIAAVMFRYERDMARLERQNEERKIKTDEK